MQDGFLTTLGHSLKQPSANMSWTQLAAATIFVIVVLFAWRQVTFAVMGE